MSASEKIVRKDPALSALDDRLAAAWQHAKDAGLDTAAFETARTQQWLWRQHNCTDAARVKNRYDCRIVELNADFKQAKETRREASKHHSSNRISRLLLRMRSGRRKAIQWPMRRRRVPRSRIANPLRAVMK